MVQSNTMKFGIVIIGRNEGVRLNNCIASVIDSAVTVVYVDSGSTDNSVNMALNQGVSVVKLDMSIPFTAARARNEGARHLLMLAPATVYIQFVDGDCEVVNHWMDQALHFLDQHPDVAVVYGRCRERHPEFSVYNLMCDIEWNMPIGQAKFCGGNALMRVDAFAQVDGFRASLIAGEEPELCVRLRALGWKIWRIDAEMVLHDAAMEKFSQWWRRGIRTGHAFAEGAYLHGSAPERLSVRATHRNWFWGLFFPAFILLVTLVCGPLGLTLSAIYPAQVIRLALRDQKTLPAPWWRAWFLVLGKFPEMLGQSKFLYSRLRGHTSELIEYK